MKVAMEGTCEGTDEIEQVDRCSHSDICSCACGLQADSKALQQLLWDELHHPNKYTSKQHKLVS